mgnify:FL=1
MRILLTSILLCFAMMLSAQSDIDVVIMKSGVEHKCTIQEI